jgi:cation diffusion facilitator CzcD-associated flavoprotein CzcO
MLCPRDHPYGTKRPPIDTEYYQTFNRQNVTLVDVRRAPIEEVTPTGIRTADREYRLDLIVFATGFDAMTGSILRIDVRGRNGLRLADKWAEGPRSYLGLAVAGFPNMFTITGPGSPSVLANMPMAIEQHVEWIGRCITELEARGAPAVEVTETAEKEWGEQVAAAVNETLYAKGNSWYLGANIPGKQRVFMPYVGGFAKYEAICDQVADGGYDGFNFEPVSTR